MGGEDGSALLGRNDSQGHRHSIDAVRELLLVAPERPDRRVHDGNILKPDNVQAIDYVGDAKALEFLRKGAIDSVVPRPLLWDSQYREGMTCLLE